MATSRGRKLTNNTRVHVKPQRLVKTEFPFKLAISVQLDNHYCFKKMRRKGLADLDRFISETIGKGLTISQVDHLFLRTKGPVKEHRKIKGESRDIVHYGKSQHSFRIHGFYNKDGYFVIYQIDPNHKKHK